MIEQYTIDLPAFERGCHLITDHIIRHIGALPAKGLLNLFIMHTSAGLTINENADSLVRSDLSEILDHLVPENEPYYSHTYEGSDDMPAHAKSSLVSTSLTIPIADNKLRLGTWQGVYLCEFRNKGGRRRIFATVVSE